MRSPRRPLRALMQLVCIGLLIAAQQGALMHQAGHLRDRLSLQFQQHDEDKKAAHSALCDYHGAFAEVLGAIASPAGPLPLAAYDAEHRAGLCPSVLPVAQVTPTARGPPVLL